MPPTHSLIAVICFTCAAPPTALLPCAARMSSSTERLTLQVPHAASESVSLCVSHTPPYWSVGATSAGQASWIAATVLAKAASILAWLLAMQHPEAVRTLTVCNIPHPAVAQKRMFRSPRQLMRSWYIFFFQLPLIPQAALAYNGYRGLARGLINDCKPGTFTKDDIRMFLEAWRRQGLSGGVNWYRALIRHPRRLSDPPPRVTAPTLMVWGEDDVAIGKELSYGTEDYVDTFEIHYLPNTSHWVQQEEPATVNRLLLEHLKRYG